MNIPIAKTVFEESDFEEILKPLRSGWIVQGPYVLEFERKWSEFTGAKNSIAVSNCTTALHMSLAALGISYNDEVIVPAFTWVSTANAVEYLGAKPIFCDIDLSTFNIDPTKIEELITPKTKAIIPVHLFGVSAEMNQICKIAQKYNLAIVEDAACGFASRYQGKHVGNFGNVGCFSFHPRKALTTGEGGMITTADDALAVRLRSMRDHGAAISDHQRHTGPKPYLLPEFPMLGYNYRMTDIQASIGSTQMDRAQQIHISRQRIANVYDRKLATAKNLALPIVAEPYVHGYQAYVSLFGGANISLAMVANVNQRRNQFMDYLQGRGISTRPGTHAVHLLGYYRDKYAIRAEDYPNAYIADQCSLALPLYPSMSDEEIDYVVNAVLDWKEN